MKLTAWRAALAALGAVAVLAGACETPAASGADEGEDASPGAGMCAPEVPDCVDTVVDDGAKDVAGWDDAMVDEARIRAEELLGVDEASLDGDVRIGRRGDETMALNEDYVVGRLSVELDPDDDGVHRVVRVIVELPEGPATFQE